MNAISVRLAPREYLRRERRKEQSTINTANCDDHNLPIYCARNSRRETANKTANGYTANDTPDIYFSSDISAGVSPLETLGFCGCTPIILHARDIHYTNVSYTVTGSRRRDKRLGMRSKEKRSSLCSLDTYTRDVLGVRVRIIGSRYFPVSRIPANQNSIRVILLVHRTLFWLAGIHYRQHRRFVRRAPIRFGHCSRCDLETHRHDNPKGRSHSFPEVEFLDWIIGSAFLIASRCLHRRRTVSELSIHDRENFVKVKKTLPHIRWDEAYASS